MDGGIALLKIINYSTCIVRLRLICCMHSDALILLSFSFKCKSVVSVGIPNVESSQTLWGPGKGISRQCFPCFLLRKEADSSPGPPKHKWRYSITASSFRPALLCF
jgi:hypothetical protein